VKSQTSSNSSCQTLNDDKIELKMLNSFHTSTKSVKHHTKSYVKSTCWMCSYFIPQQNLNVNDTQSSNYETYLDFVLSKRHSWFWYNFNNI
jgi:hypothetical protein